MPRPRSRSGPRIIVQVGVEEARSVQSLRRVLDPPDGGDYLTSPLVAHRLTQSMARALAAQIKRDLIRRGFRPLKSFRLSLG